MKEAAKRLRGSICPVVTPFNEDLSIDFGTMEKLINWQIENGSHGISVTGTTGEPAALTLDERERVFDVAKSAVGGRVPFVPATGTTNYEETLRLTKYAEKIGADAAMVIVPYYNKPSQEGLYRHFRGIAESVSIPLIIYNIPGRTAVNMAPQTMKRLRDDCPNIIGAKESNKDFEHICHVIHQCGRDFNVYSGIELLCYPLMAIGGAGHISCTANIAPREVADLYNLVMDGKWHEAIDLHYHQLPLNEMLFWETNPIPLKYAMGLMGLIKPYYRLPLCEPSEKHKAGIREILQQYNIEIREGA
jgi:4-hydroxy-tetrahydrodipicolinate synthase